MKPEELDREQLILRVKELEKELRKKQSEECVMPKKTSSLFEFSEKGLRLKLYTVLLRKYSKEINENEQKTIGEVKALVNGDDLTIQSIISGFKPEEYDFEKDYLKAAENAFRFVKKEIHYVKADIPIDYFLSPVEILTGKIADDEDQAIFLCSMLLALEDEAASVVIAEMDDLSTHAFVTIDIDEKAFFLDPSQEHDFEDFSGSTQDVLKKYSFKGNKIKRFLYKFNRFEYKSFIEEE